MRIQPRGAVRVESSKTVEAVCRGIPAGNGEDLSNWIDGSSRQSDWESGSNRSTRELSESQRSGR